MREEMKNRSIDYTRGVAAERMRWEKRLLAAMECARRYLCRQPFNADYWHGLIAGVGLVEDPAKVCGGILCGENVSQAASEQEVRHG